MFATSLRARFLCLVVAAASAGCPGAPPPAPPAPPPARAKTTALPPAREDGRLVALATPAGYRLSLEIDPTRDRFRGTARIAIDVPAPTSHVVLHARGLDVTSARTTGRAPLAGRVSMRMASGGVSPEELVVSFDESLAPGRHELEIAYSAPFDAELSGLYRVKDGERWYAFTQFEPTGARRAYPCFDEPAFKVPFEVDVTAPQGMLAVGNTQEIARDREGEGTRFRFAKTAPLPTYLVAFAVGDFEVTAYREGDGRRPAVRLVAPKGRPARQGDLAAEAATKLLSELETYFGIPYPFDKLDLVAVPDFSPGGMENAGLITFREELLLLDPARASVLARRNQARLLAHELGHQWFGNLVTAAWWDDLWLNEAMASWVEARAVDAVWPAMGARVDARVATEGAMLADELESARAIRQPATSIGHIREAFDGITYAKGAGVLSTIEGWLGEEPFRRGIQSYLRDNAGKSVTSAALLEALDRVSGKDVTQMAAAFLDRPGIPVVDTHVQCAAGRWHAEITQDVWRPLGKTPREAEDRVWTIPVCARAPKDKGQTCAELAFGAPSLLAGKGACPGAIHPNVGGAYYRFTMPDKEMLRLAEARKELDPASRVSLLTNAWASLRAGTLAPKTLLAILPAFDDERSRQGIAGLASVLAGVDESLLSEASRAGFRRYAAARLRGHKRAVGWQPKSPSEADEGDRAIVRRVVLRAMADLAEDAATVKEADELARRWLDDPSSVDADTAAVAVEVASRTADATRLAALRDRAAKAATREQRVVALRAMAGFDDEALLASALDVTLTEEIRPSEVRYVLGAALARRKVQRSAEAWVRAHWDALRAKLPGGLSRQLVGAAGVGCSREEASAQRDFYEPRLREVEGAARGLASALERVTTCAALHDAASADLAKALGPAAK